MWLGKLGAFMGMGFDSSVTAMLGRNPSYYMGKLRGKIDAWIITELSK